MGTSIQNNKKISLDSFTLQKVKNLYIMSFMSSSDSFSKFLKTPVFSDVPKVFVSDLTEESTSVFNPKKERLVVLAADIIGTVSSKSYLVLPESQAQLLADVCSKTMGITGMDKMEILKEIDNIIVASVITCVSNHTKLKIYGGIPRVLEMSHDNLHSVVDEELHSLDFDVNDFDYYICAKTQFLLPQYPSIKPMFLWVYPEEFVSKMK